MSPADGIRKLGFRRWYERQLIESHAYFVSCFLCMIMIAACMEGFSLRGQGLKTLVTAAIILAGGILGIISLKRYKTLLERAEHIAERSTCAQCSEYGRLQVLQSGGGPDGMLPDNTPWIRVQCRKCGNQWLIE